MANEITLKDLYDIIDKRFSGLEGKVEKYHDSFIRFEEGKLTQALQDIEKSKGEIKALQTQNINQDAVNTKNTDRRKDWMWGAFEKIIFALVGAGFLLLGIMLQKLGILNLH